MHEGRLELITWNGKDYDGEEMGWGVVLLEEADDHRNRSKKSLGRRGAFLRPLAARVPLDLLWAERGPGLRM